MKINEELRRIREEQRIFQSELAENIGKSETTILDFENGKTNTGYLTVIQIAEELGVHLCVSGIELEQVKDLLLRIQQVINENGDTDLLIDMETEINDAINLLIP